MATVSSAMPRLLAGINWDNYERLLRQFDQEGRHVRCTYDQGKLEIMTVSPEHERAKKLLARLLETLTEELDIPIVGLGNTTFRRQELDRGLEPDDCWYIQHEKAMRNRTEIDLAIDPPPDLVLEIEISRSAMDRMDIYAHLGVPEVWRFDGTTLRINALGDDGQYGEVSSSPTFPQVSLETLAHFVAQRGAMDDNAVVKQFRAWLRATLEQTNPGPA